MKTVWVIGASSGIGRATALAYAQLGNRVLISARNAEHLDDVKNQFPELVTCLPLDITDENSRFNAISEARKWCDSIDILIHSAGVSQRAKAIDTELHVVKRLFEINFFGLIELNRLAIPLLKKGSTIAVVSSLVGKFATQYRSAYAASKHALEGYFEGLRYELEKYGISICMIYPGYILTDLSLHALTEDGSKYGKLDATQAKGITAEVCANKIVYAIQNKKLESFIGKSELFGVYLKRFFPSLLRKIIKRRSITS